MAVDVALHGDVDRLAAADVSEAWTHYITGSLKTRIETGQGQIRTRAEDQAAIAAG